MKTEFAYRVEGHRRGKGSRGRVATMTIGDWDARNAAEAKKLAKQAYPNWVITGAEKVNY